LEFDQRPWKPPLRSRPDTPPHSIRTRNLPLCSCCVHNVSIGRRLVHKPFV
jgi:hypothetical protein